MRDDGCAGRFTEAVDDIDHAGWQAGFFKPAGEFQGSERSLFGGLENAGAAGRNGRGELPGSHEQRIVPGNDLTGDADRLAHGEAQGVCWNRIDASGDFVREAAVVRSEEHTSELQSPCNLV